MTGRIVITGASGFIGRHLVETLSRGGFDLTLAVRDVAGCSTKFRGVPRVALVPYDLADANGSLECMLCGAAAVVHLAGLAHVPPGTGSAAFREANERATQRLTEQAGRAGVRLFIHMSSIAAVSGNASRTVIDDAADPKPANDYGRSKLAAEQHVAALTGQGICAISLRPPLVVGHDAPGNWRRLQKLARSAVPLPFASVCNARSLASVDLLAQAVAQLCGAVPGADKSGNYCIANPGLVSLKEMVEGLREGMGVSNRLFRFPTPALRLSAILANKRQLAASLIDDLILDPSRFFSTFAIPVLPDIGSAIRRSGERYRELNG